MRNHTATHLAHKALRTILGSHLNQSGSLVAPDYFRFDFNHFQKLSMEEIRAVEKDVNERIRNNLKVSIKAKVPFQDAINEGAMALFDEKYGDTVRMVSVENYSKELCGGTHVQQTGQIGFFKITGESSVASGIRRIEAVTGDYAERLAAWEHQLLDESMKILNIGEESFISRLEQLVEERRLLEKQVKDLRSKAALPEFHELLAKAEKIRDKFLFCSSQINVED